MRVIHSRRMSLFLCFLPMYAFSSALVAPRYAKILHLFALPTNPFTNIHSLRCPKERAIVRLQQPNRQQRERSALAGPHYALCGASYRLYISLERSTTSLSCTHPDLGPMRPSENTQRWGRMHRTQGTHAASHALLTAVLCLNSLPLSQRLTARCTR